MIQSLPWVQFSRQCHSLQIEQWNARSACYCWSSCAKLVALNRPRGRATRRIALGTDNGMEMTSLHLGQFLISHPFVMLKARLYVRSVNQPCKGMHLVFLLIQEAVRSSSLSIKTTYSSRIAPKWVWQCSSGSKVLGRIFPNENLFLVSLLIEIFITPCPFPSQLAWHASERNTTTVVICSRTLHVSSDYRTYWSSHDTVHHTYYRNSHINYLLAQDLRLAKVNGAVRH